MSKIYLCFGDSITYGKGEVPSIGYPGRLLKEVQQESYHNSVFNLGVPGGTSTELAKAIEVEIERRYIREDSEYYCLVMIGTNDAKTINGKSNTTDDKFEKNIYNIIEAAQSFKMKIAFINCIHLDEKKANKHQEGVTYSNERIDQLNHIMGETCKYYKIPILDVNEHFEGITFPKDGIHPDKKGYDLMFALINEFLLKQRWI